MDKRNDVIINGKIVGSYDPAGQGTSLTLEEINKRAHVLTGGRNNRKARLKLAALARKGVFDK